MSRTFVVGITTVVAALMISVFGLVGASASPNAAGTEHFRIMSTVATSQKLSVIATGRFTAGGIDIPGKAVDKLVFPGGTFKIKYHSTTFKANLNSRTCLFTEFQRGTYQLTGGAGSYSGIRGSGAFELRILGVFARNSKGQCTHLSAPATYQSVVTAQGPIGRT
jgi:hypothetical protein